MNIVLALNNFNNLTGSEMYVYELARVLAKRNHHVIILANEIGGEIAKRIQDNGVDIFSFFSHPDIQADIIHASQPLPTAYTLSKFPSVPHVVTIHSSLPFETPMKDPHILKYIIVRPEIAEVYPNLNTVLIYNGVDMNRFNRVKGTSTFRTKKKILFVGTMDHLRQHVISDLIMRTEKDRNDLMLVSNIPSEIRTQLPNHVIPMHPQWDIEEYNKECDETAGIFLGRTTIEGWACGKPGWIYEVDQNGNILDIKVTEPPQDMTRFDIEFMTDRVLELYEEVKQ